MYIVQPEVAQMFAQSHKAAAKPRRRIASVYDAVERQIVRLILDYVICLIHARARASESNFDWKWVGQEDAKVSGGASARDAALFWGRLVEMDLHISRYLGAGQ